MAKYFKPQRAALLTKQHLKRTFLVTASILVVVSVVVGGYFAYKYLQNKKRISDAAPKCSSETLKQAATLLDYTHKDQLKQLVASITKVKSYDKDLNCLYVATSYYYISGDGITGKQFLDKFNKVYNPTKSLSGELTSKGFTAKDLQSRANIYGSHSGETLNNSGIGGKK